MAQGPLWLIQSDVIRRAVGAPPKRGTLRPRGAPPGIEDKQVPESRGLDGGIRVSDSNTSDVTASNSYIDAELVDRLKRVEDCFNADVITCVHPIMAPMDDVIRTRMDELTNKRPNLLVILETEGGSIETTERIADVFRHHYKGENILSNPKLCDVRGNDSCDVRRSDTNGLLLDPWPHRPTGAEHGRSNGAGTGLYREI